MTLHIFSQDVVTRGADLAAAAAAHGWAWSPITIGTQAETEAGLAALDAQLAETGAHPVVFCSLQIARWIRRAYPRLARGVFLDERLLSWNGYAVILDPDDLLNGRAVLVPWAHLPREGERLATMMGPHLFLRPNSPMKPFTGFDVRIEDLAREWSAHSQTTSIDPSELVVVAPAKALPATEHRFWLIDGQISQAAPRGAAYGWDPEVVHAPATDAIVDLALRLARVLEPHDTMLVADLVMSPAGPRLVELNAISTSGFYPGIDATRLLGDIGTMFVLD